MKKQTTLVSWQTPIAILAVFFVLSAGFQRCSKSSYSSPSSPGSVQLKTDPVLGSILTDNKGYTLYYFANDIDGLSRCTGSCLAFWPIFYDSLISTATIGAGLVMSDFTTITSSTGGKQTAYKGWPLYYYAPANTSGANVRELVGETKGEKVDNIWFVVKTNYAIMMANKKVGTSGTTDSTVKEFLTDSVGNTLYYFVRDSINSTTLPTNCTGTCITSWPVFYTSNLTLPSLLLKTDFGEITRTDGAGGTNRKQSTYRGRPLYYRGTDAFKRGAVTGEGIGNLWHVMNPGITKIN